MLTYEWTLEKEYTDKGGGKTRVVIWPQSMHESFELS